MALIKRVYVDGETIITAQNLNDIQDEIISQGNTLVPKTRTVAGKALSSNITLNAGDIGYNSATNYSASTVGKIIKDLVGVTNAINLADVQSITTASTDLDNYTTGGMYYFAGAYTPTHKPSGTSDFGFLLVVQSGASNARIFQIWINHSTSSASIFFRSSSTTTLSWSSWNRIPFGDLTAKTINPTIVTTLPTGVTNVGKIQAVQSGNVVTVFVGLTRDTTDLTNFTVIASGLPIPKARPYSGDWIIPHGQITPASNTVSRALNLWVNSSGQLTIARGTAPSGTVMFLGTFTYITDEI